MQISTGAAFAASAISAAIGFGVAFLLERTLNRGTQSKPRRWLVTAAMISLGLGLTSILNELLGLALLELPIRTDKIVMPLIANVLLVPAVLFGISRLVGGKNVTAAQGSIAAPNASSSKAAPALILVAAAAVLYMAYHFFGSLSSDSVYEVYFVEDPKNCNSFPSHPSATLKPLYKQDTNEVIATFEFLKDGIKNSGLQKLSDCTILDAKNWSCGGTVQGLGYSWAFYSPKYSMVNGVFAIENSRGIADPPACPTKVVKR